jgi:hypothetical protein
VRCNKRGANQSARRRRRKGVVLSRPSLSLSTLSYLQNKLHLLVLILLLRLLLEGHLVVAVGQLSHRAGLVFCFGGDEKEREREKEERERENKN